jgi:hypothetical protein
VDHFFVGVLPAEEPSEAPDSATLVRSLAAGYGDHLAGLLDQQIELASYFRFLLSLFPDRAELVRGRQQAVEAEPDFTGPITPTDGFFDPDRPKPSPARSRPPLRARACSGPGRPNRPRSGFVTPSSDAPRAWSTE